MMYELISHTMGPCCTNYYVEYYSKYNYRISWASGTDIQAARRTALKKIDYCIKA